MILRSFARIFPSRILTRQTLGPDILRLSVCAILFTHGSYRLAHGEASGLGDVLVDEHIPAPYLCAWLICLAETGGTILLAFRLFAVPIAAILAFIYATGIYLFNRYNGFFSVGGHAAGGWEYNALPIACLFAIAWENRNAHFFIERNHEASR
jgi:putative oxidoreductase